ncbi:hypothetical protein AX16_007166 [Volvariella volvacea WC 439]|nr:hypothetical protein AX16_007166 [Volvariella volvacea WC 439]
MPLYVVLHRLATDVLPSRDIDGFSYSPDTGHLRLDMFTLSSTIRKTICALVSFESLHLDFFPYRYYEERLSDIRDMMSRQSVIKNFKLVDQPEVDGFADGLLDLDMKLRWRRLIELIQIALARGC